MAERQGSDRPTIPARSNATVSEVLLAFMQWAATHYRTPDGEPTSEIGELKWSIKPVRELYGHTPATEFGPRAARRRASAHDPG